jgi:hypothetical protein
MINAMRSFIIILALGFLSLQVFAQNQCIVGNEKNSQLLDNLDQAQKNSLITQKIYQKYDLYPKTEADANCPKGNCGQNTSTQALTPLPTGGAPASPAYVHFNEACIEVVAKIKAGTSELNCPSQKKGTFDFCFSKSQANYQSAVVSDFYKCIRSNQDFPISADTLFEMYTLESAFKPYYSNPGGAGLGQLTSIFIKDIHQKHRGRPILEAIADSTDLKCDAAKIIAAKDLKKTPTLNNRCDFVQAGEGLERNILYTLVGLANSWNKDISPLMKDYNNKHVRDPALLDAQKFALLNAYGPGGRGAARAAVRRLTKLKPADFVKAMSKPLYSKKQKNLTTYTTSIAEKQKQLMKIMKEPLLSDYKKNGAKACLESLY